MIQPSEVESPADVEIVTTLHPDELRPARPILQRTRMLAMGCTIAWVLFQIGFFVSQGRVYQPLETAIAVSIALLFLYGCDWGTYRKMRGQLPRTIIINAEGGELRTPQDPQEVFALEEVRWQVEDNWRDMHYRYLPRSRAVLLYGPIFPPLCVPPTQSDGYLDAISRLGIPKRTTITMPVGLSLLAVISGLAYLLGYLSYTILLAIGAPKYLAAIVCLLCVVDSVASFLLFWQGINMGRPFKISKYPYAIGMLFAGFGSFAASATTIAIMLSATFINGSIGAAVGYGIVYGEKKWRSQELFKSGDISEAREELAAAERRRVG